MGEARRKMLDKLAKLEGEGLWLVAESHAEGELLRRLRTQGEVVSPCRGVYARGVVSGRHVSYTYLPAD